MTLIRLKQNIKANKIIVLKYIINVFILSLDEYEYTLDVY